MHGNKIAAIIGSVLVGGLALAALLDYEAAPQGPNQALEILTAGVTNFYQTLEGRGTPETLPRVS